MYGIYAKPNAKPVRIDFTTIFHFSHNQIDATVKLEIAIMAINFSVSMDCVFKTSNFVFSA
jgi:hypothetical protein